MEEIGFFNLYKIRVLIIFHLCVIFDLFHRPTAKLQFQIRQNVPHLSKIFMQLL